MPLTKPNLDDPRAQQAFVKGLLPFLDGTLSPDQVAGILKRLPDEYHPLQVYILKADKDSVLADAKMAGWQFLAGGQLGAPVAGHVTMSAQDPAWKMTSLSRGPRIADFLQAAIKLITLVQPLEDLQIQNYELRMLSIPGLLIEAFWLKSP